MNTSLIQDISAGTLENKLLMISDIHVAVHSTEFIVYFSKLELPIWSSDWTLFHIK